MAQRKRASQSKSKRRPKAPPKSLRFAGVAAAGLPDSECLGADVNAPVTQRMIGTAKGQLGAVLQLWGRFQGPQ